MVFIGNPRSETKMGGGRSERPKIQAYLAKTTTHLYPDDEEGGEAVVDSGSEEDSESGRGGR